MSKPPQKPDPKSGNSKNDAAGKDSLASVLNFEERSHLVVLIDALTSSIITDVSAAFKRSELLKEPSKESADASDSVSDAELETLRKSNLHWYTKWRKLVLNRVCEAANTRWERLEQKKQDGPAKSWDELSWDDEPNETKPKQAPPADVNLQALYPPVTTPLASQDHDKRLLLLHSMLLLLLSLKHYYSPSRLLLLRLASSLDLSTNDVDRDEERTAASLVSGAKEMSASEEVEQKAKETQSSRSWKVLGASVAGAALIGLTGGLAAPLVAAGIGTVMGGLGLGATAAAGLLGSLAGSSVLVGGLFGAYGARMTGQMMEEYAREISDFAFIPLKSNSPGGGVKEMDPADRRLRVTIGVSGWLTEDSDIVHPWRVLGPGTEVFALRWELEALSGLGHGLRELVTSAAWNYARSEILKLTVFATLIGAVALPLGLLKLGQFVDNPFRIAKTRADKAGEVLADAIINRAQGERPVALVGYSLGARLIYSCLQHLAKRQAFGLVDSVVLYGAPVPSSDDAWRRMRAVVGGRLVNIYSENDYVLGFLYRANSIQAGIAGLRSIEVQGVENKNVSDIVTSHFQYRHLIGRALHELGWRDLDEAELDRERKALELLHEQERKIAEILEDNDTNVEEKRQLKELMETQAPVHQESSHAIDVPPPESPVERPPELPPRRPAPPAETTRTVLNDQHDDTQKPTAHAESEQKSGTPMQTFEDTLHEDDENDDIEEKFSGIQMVDND